MIKLGRIDKITEVSLLSSHVVLSREEHLHAAVHDVAHVGQRYNYRLVCDSLYLGKDHNVFKKYDWSDFYRDAKEVLPSNAPKP